MVSAYEGLTGDEKARCDELTVVHDFEEARRRNGLLPRLEEIRIEPSRQVLASEAHQPLRVTAHYSDGETREVTRQTVFQSNVPEIADVDSAGNVITKGQGGLFAVMARFGGRVAVSLRDHAA